MRFKRRSKTDTMLCAYHKGGREPRHLLPSRPPQSLRMPPSRARNTAHHAGRGRLGGRGKKQPAESGSRREGCGAPDLCGWRRRARSSPGTPQTSRPAAPSAGRVCPITPGHGEAAPAATRCVTSRASRHRHIEDRQDRAESRAARFGSSVGYFL